MPKLIPSMAVLLLSHAGWKSQGLLISAHHPTLTGLATTL